jgi:hypothetical protein
MKSLFVRARPTSVPRVAFTRVFLTFTAPPTPGAAISALFPHISTVSPNRLILQKTGKGRSLPNAYGRRAPQLMENTPGGISSARDAARSRAWVSATRKTGREENSTVGRGLPRFLCFHALPHSLAPLKTLSPTFSSPSKLFAQNRGGGIPLNFQLSTLNLFTFRPLAHTASATKIISGDPSPIAVRSKSPYSAATRNPHRASKCSTSYRKKYRSVHANTSRSSFPCASCT